MNHSFNVEVAEKYGIEAALLIENIAFWIKHNRDENKNFVQGRYWVYNSLKSFSQLFPYINLKKIQRTLTKLEKLNIIKSGNFNRSTCDRTKWYTIVDERINEIYDLTVESYKEIKIPRTNCPMDETKLSNGRNQNVQWNNPNCPMHLDKMSNGTPHFVQPIPVIISIIKTIIRTTIKTTTKQKSKLYRPLKFSDGFFSGKVGPKIITKKLINFLQDNYALNLGDTIKILYRRKIFLKYNFS